MYILYATCADQISGTSCQSVLDATYCNCAPGGLLGESYPYLQTSTVLTIDPYRRILQCPG